MGIMNIAKKFDTPDISLIKITTAAIVLLIASLWPPLVSLDWYWYVIVAVVAGIRPMMHMIK